MDRLIVIPQRIGILFRSAVPQGIGREDDAVDGGCIGVIAIYHISRNNTLQFIQLKTDKQNTYITGL